MNATGTKNAGWTSDQLRARIVKGRNFGEFVEFGSGEGVLTRHYFSTKRNCVACSQLLGSLTNVKSTEGEARELHLGLRLVCHRRESEETQLETLVASKAVIGDQGPLGKVRAQLGEIKAQPEWR